MSARGTRLCLTLAFGVAGCAGSTGPDGPGHFTTLQTVVDDAQVSAGRVSYPSEGLAVSGIVCRPKALGPHPLVMANHGGWGGLGGELTPTSGCVSLARAGYVVIEPSYRGEDGSGGTIELCLGEATDIRTMLAIALTDPEVDQNRVSVLGGSHGGCSTLRALIDGAARARVVAVAGPTDWAATYQALIDSIDAGASGDRLLGFQVITSDTRKYLGGTPAQVPVVYAARSVLTRVKRLDQYPGQLLIQHGVDDEIVRVEESCALVALAAGFTAYHVDAAGQVVAAAPAKCSGFQIAWSAGPLPAGWPGSRYLVVYEALGHGGGANAGRQGADAFGFMDPH